MQCLLQEEDKNKDNVIVIIHIWLRKRNLHAATPFVYFNFMIPLTKTKPEDGLAHGNRMLSPGHMKSPMMKLSLCR